MTVLVTGAAGYIGSVVAERLVEHGHAVAAFDDLSQGHRAAVPAAAGFFEGDLRDRLRLAQVMSAVRPEAVVHLAAEALVGESVTEPAKFFDVNVSGGLNLLGQCAPRACAASSSRRPPRCTASRRKRRSPRMRRYGRSTPTAPRSWRSSRCCPGTRPRMVCGTSRCATSTRVGATAERGEHHVPETHLIAILLEVALGLRPEIRIFGSDYETPDGTCIRDYVHVGDIADAHVLALGRMDRIESGAFNLGGGTGFSNREVVEAARRVTGHPIPAVAAPRRAGDPARLVAGAGRASDVLGWSPRFPTLDEMIETAWTWRKDRPQPYSG